MNTITLAYQQYLNNLPASDATLLRFATIKVMYGELLQLGMELAYASLSGDTGNNSHMVTNTDTTGLVPGQPFWGEGIPDDTYIFSITSPTQLFMTKAATQTKTGAALFVGNDKTILSAGSLVRTIVLKTNTLGDSLWGGDADLIKTATSNLYRGALALGFPGTVTASAPVVT